MRGSVHATPFLLLRKENEMKGKKKIIPLLLSLIMILGSSLTVFAKEINGYEMPSYYAEDDKYITWSLGDERMWCIDVPKNAKLSVVIDTEGHILFNSDIPYSCGWIADSGYYYTEEWVFEVINTRPLSVDYTEIIYTDFDICDTDGNVVFRAPLPTPVQVVEILPKMIAPQMKIITIIAVSCLALVISLIILRKKLPIFLLR